MNSVGIYIQITCYQDYSRTEFLPSWRQKGNGSHIYTFQIISSCALCVPELVNDEKSYYDKT